MSEQANVARVAALDCATLSDAMDRLGVVGQCAKISARGDDFQLAGRAFTVRYIPASRPAGTVGDYVDDVAPGSIIVLDNDGREDVTVWGDILTEIAHKRRMGGTVIDGICRDIALCRKLGYPIFSRGHWMRTGKDRVEVEGIEVPVSIGAVRVLPGDLVRGDADGVVVLPAAYENAILDAAETIGDAEDAIRALVRGGKRLDDARSLHGYHRLQSGKELP
jgi:4-hydroxy-4-methyl-2-oxoglutarate aldolase